MTIIIGGLFLIGLVAAGSGLWLLREAGRALRESMALTKKAREIFDNVEQLKKQESGQLPRTPDFHPDDRVGDGVIET